MANDESSSGTSIPVIIGIIAAVVVLVLLVIGVTGCLVFWRMRRKQTRKSEMYAVGVNLSAISGFMTDIEIQHQIGGGNFGDVYRGLWQDTTVVALKKLKGFEQLKEFETEVNTLRYMSFIHSF